MYEHHCIQRPSDVKETVVQQLLENEAVIALSEESKRGALCIAVWYAHEVVLLLLLEMAVDITAENEHAKPILDSGTENGWHYCEQLLWQKGRNSSKGRYEKDSDALGGTRTGMEY